MNRQGNMLHAWMITAKSDTKVAIRNVDRHGRQRFEGPTWNRQAGFVTVKLSVACTHSNLTIISVNLSKTEHMIKKMKTISGNVPSLNKPK